MKNDKLLFDDYEFWLLVRAALLMFVDAIEQRISLPRTKDLREHVKDLRKQVKGIQKKM